MSQKYYYFARIWLKCALDARCSFDPRRHPKTPCFNAIGLRGHRDHLVLVKPLLRHYFSMTSSDRGRSTAHLFFSAPGTKK